MALQVTTIMLGVEDLARSKVFYSDGLGCKVEQDYPSFVLLNLGNGSSSIALSRPSKSMPSDRSGALYPAPSMIATA